jgi:hypothetical protein
MRSQVRILNTQLLVIFTILLLFFDYQLTHSARIASSIKINGHHHTVYKQH